MTPSPRTRFAPAPTGLLHLGHVVNAVFVWGLARRLGADVVLRIEDHDTQRSRAEFETAILDDLDWLGFAPDRYPTAAFRAGPCHSRQSERHLFYASTAAALQARELVYGCDCSRQDIAASHAAGPLGKTGYPGTCRTRGLPLREGLTWRVRMDGSAETFEDVLLGRVEEDATSAQGDPAIRDRHGNWTYTFAVVADDLDQAITLVVRGDDLRHATPDQIRLGRMLGRATPALFAHHGLVMASPGRKLSKADSASGISDLRKVGWSPARVIGHAAALVSLVPPGTELSSRDATALLATNHGASARP